MTRVRLCFIQVGGMILNKKASLHFPAPCLCACSGTEVLISGMPYPGYTQFETPCECQVGIQIHPPASHQHPSFHPLGQGRVGLRETVLK